MCVVIVIWLVPNDEGEESSTDYFAIINGTVSESSGETISIISDNNQMQVSTLLPVARCATHNVTILARNACGDSQSNSTVILDSELRHRINPPDFTTDPLSYTTCNSLLTSNGAPNHIFANGMLIA